MILHLDCTTFEIQVEGGAVLSIAQAQEAWDAGLVGDCNVGFHRLATEYGWDIDALRAFYASCEA